MPVGLLATHPFVDRAQRGGPGGSYTAQVSHEPVHLLALVLCVPPAAAVSWSEEAGWRDVLRDHGVEDGDANTLWPA